MTVDWKERYEKIRVEETLLKIGRQSGNGLLTNDYVRSIVWGVRNE